MRRSLAMLLLTAVGASLLEGALLDRFGEPYREIVIAEAAADSAHLAARELQSFARTLCGAQLPIVHAATQSPVIFVGESSALKRRGVTADALPPEGYLIRTGSNYLAILGRDYKGKPLLGPVNPWRGIEAYNPTLKLAAFGEAGTLTGVYEFLRQVGNVRFYLPGELGTVIAPVANLVVPDLTISGAPRVHYRYPWFSMFGHSPESALWARRIGFGGTAPVMITHSYRKFQKYRDTHPDYFARADGKRAFGSECVADGHGHLCLTSPAVIEQWAHDIIAYFEANPQVAVFPLAPQDGLTRICECPNCQAELRPDAGPKGKFSYHIWNFAGKVAALVGKRFPDKFVGCLAYAHYRTPPPDIGHLPHTAVMFCSSRSRLANPTTAARLHTEIEAWSAKVDRVYLWNWYLDHWLPWSGLPVLFADTIERELQHLFRNPKYSGEFVQANGQRSRDYDQMPTPGMQHLNLYATARLYWDPKLDIDAVLDEYFERFYGPAEVAMKTFWLTAQKRRSETIAKKPKCTPEDVFTPVLIAELNGLLKQALDAAPAGSPYRKRVELIQKEFSVGAGRLTRLVRIGVQKLELPLVDEDDPFRMIRPTRFRGKNGEPYTPPTWLYAGYDRQYVYIKVICFEPMMSELRCDISTADDAELWKDDSIEIFLCPDETERANCYQLVLNANGVLFDGKVLSAGTRDPRWNSEATVTTKREDNRWIAELRIPFLRIGVNDPNFAGALAANFYRNRSVGGTTSCWSPTGASAHYAPNRFGLLTLRRQEEP